jgi:hypothetical protein
MTYRFLLFLATGCCVVFSETDIMLSGAAATTNARPLQGVIVTLIHKQLSDTTGSDGKFIISTNTSTIRAQNSTLSRLPPIPATVSLYSLRGQLLGNFNRFPNDRIPQKNGLPIKPSTGVYLLKYHGPVKTPMVKCLLEQNVSRPFSLPENIRPKSLLKQRVFYDTLNFTKNGYVPKRLPIASFIDTLGTIKLDTAIASFPIRKPQSYDKVQEFEPLNYYTRKVWDADYVCDCQKTELNANIYIQVSPIAQDTFFTPPWQPKYYHVVNAWIIKDGILQTLDTAGYDPGGNHGNEALWFGFKGKYYTTGYSSMSWGGRRCNTPDCLKIFVGLPFSAIAQNGCARLACIDRPSLPVSCVRVNSDGTVPKFVDFYEADSLPCKGDGLCQ